MRTPASASWCSSSRRLFIGFTVVTTPPASHTAWTAITI